jgi:glycosyltransferase involved in cell wall biosynthesis
MKIDVVCYNLSNNALGRAYLLADLLRLSGHSSRIIGLQLGESVWSPFAGGDIETVAVRSAARYPEALGKLGRLVSLMDCDVALASKPRVASFGAALLKRLRTGGAVRVLLDIDDWEAGLDRPLTAGKLLGGLPGLVNIDSMYDPLVMEKLTSRADGILVSSDFLCKRYGGAILPHVRDTDLFDPGRYDRESLRERLGISDGFVIAFLGSIRQHKGIGLLLRALPRLEKIGARLLLIGTGAVDVATRRALDASKARIIELPYVPYRRLPDLYMASDIVVLPQMDTPFGRAQLPMKLLDAMAMARPIISTNVSDIPAVLDGCGIILDRYEEEELVDKILSLHADPDLMRSLGEKARRRCVERYSYAQGKAVLARALGDL